MNSRTGTLSYIGDAAIYALSIQPSIDVSSKIRELFQEHFQALFVELQKLFCTRNNGSLICSVFLLWP